MKTQIILRNTKLEYSYVREKYACFQSVCTWKIVYVSSSKIQNWKDCSEVLKRVLQISRKHASEKHASESFTKYLSKKKKRFCTHVIDEKEVRGLIIKTSKAYFFHKSYQKVYPKWANKAIDKDVTNLSVVKLNYQEVLLE